MKNVNSFNSEHLININNQNFRYFDLNVVAKQFDIDLYKVPISIKVILENLIRNEDGENISKSMISNVFSSLKDRNKKNEKTEIAFFPTRVLMQDFTGVPAVADLAAMRNALKSKGIEPKKINPLSRVDLVIDHSVMVDNYKNNSSLNQITEELKIVERELTKVEQKRENQRNEITKLDGILENTKIKEKELRDLIYKRLNKQPEDLEREKKLVDKKLDTHEEIKNYLQKITFQREQMGPVNLRAKIEESEIVSLIDELELEKNDLVDALTKLRQAINKINHEGKNKLISAFEKVNKNFSDLFKKLFNGGDAKLELVKSDDPLQTGLEIFARPPGKKLSNISLLSGGEKTLTAIALIFSIFLINPSPICILDEVDAALDDVNIEKFCLILNELKNNTQTKFLIITHNKITMSSIDRVYGVTMPQKGISDIVSVDFEKVDLQEAI